MDIIDIMLAKALTPQGQTEAYLAKANRAAQKAAEAEASAEATIATVTAAASDIAEAQSAAETLLATAQETIEAAQQAQSEIPKLYDSTGQNTDGTMTQKAITDALDTKANTSTTATKTYVDEKIAAIPAGGGSGSTNIIINLNSDDAGHLVAIGEDGKLIASDATEEAIIEALLRAGTYDAINAVGLDIDYANRAFTRTQGAMGKSMGSDFDSYIMYGGRTRCTVGDDGHINSFYGDSSYAEDGSNGQVMVYQPKFYYKRIVRTAEALSKGKVVRHETLLLSSTEQTGFKLAPIFNGGLDYVLLPAFDAGLVNNKLTSIAGVRPITNITITQAEEYARARGNGWHIMNMAAESANQMLQMVEYGHMNGQQAIEQGITWAPNGSNIFFITGSTSSLGNATGHAESTNVDINNTTTAMTEEGYRAISYRGMENPWGNIWSMIGGTNIHGNGIQGGGSIYIATDFNYTPGVVGSNYADVGFILPAVYGWINGMGIGNDEYDWVYLPAECSTSANSFAPVGDELWTVGQLNGSMILATGGSYGQKDSCGPFYYAADRTVNDSARYNYGAKLLYIPTKNSTYNANIAKWNNYMGG